MIFLLATQSLLDILSNHKNILAWFQKIPMQQLEISAVSIGQALETIQRMTNVAARKEAERQLDRLVNAVRNNQGIIPFGEQDAKIWAELESRELKYKMPEGSVTELSNASRMVVATALQRGATLVESAQPYHDAIQGLSIVSP